MMRRLVDKVALLLRLYVAGLILVVLRSAVKRGLLSFSFLALARRWARRAAREAIATSRMQQRRRLERLFNLAPGTLR